MGHREDQIDEVLRTGKPITHLTIRSPMSGHVLRKYQLEGDYIEEGARLFDVADLSTVWIEAQVYENELTFLKPGLSVSARLKAFPNREFTGALEFIHPHLDAESHAQGAFRPGESRPPPAAGHVRRGRAEGSRDAIECVRRRRRQRASRPRCRRFRRTFAVRAYGPAGAGLGSLVLAAGERTLSFKGETLAVPERAVIDTGARKVVYREAGPSLFEGVEVAWGRAAATIIPSFAASGRATRWPAPARFSSTPRRD